jgi:MFS family permease
LVCALSEFVRALVCACSLSDACRTQAQIIESCGASTELVPTVVQLFASGNMLGRLLCNIPSDGLVRRGYPRPLFVGAIAGLAAVAQLSLLAAAYQPDGRVGGSLQSVLLLFGAGTGGLAFGALWPHFVVLSSELFGSAYLSTNCEFGRLASFKPHNCAPCALT